MSDKTVLRGATHGKPVDIANCSSSLMVVKENGLAYASSASCFMYVVRDTPLAFIALRQLFLAHLHGYAYAWIYEIHRGISISSFLLARRRVLRKVVFLSE